MAVGYGVPVPKGKTRTQVKAKRDREDAQALKAFRDACWHREELKQEWIGSTFQWARCQSCGVVVQRGHGVFLTGEIHHRIGRRNKATRFDPSNGVLLCNALVNDCHGKAQRHEITV